MEAEAEARGAAQRADDSEEQAGWGFLVAGILTIFGILVAYAFTRDSGVFKPALVGVLLVLAGLWGRRRGKRAAYLRLHGLVGRGRILRVETAQTQKHGGKTQLRFELNVELPNREPYEVRTTRWMDAIVAARIAQSSSVVVRVNPNDLKHVLVDLDCLQPTADTPTPMPSKP